MDVQYIYTVNQGCMHVSVTLLAEICVRAHEQYRSLFYNEKSDPRVFYGALLVGVLLRY